MKVLSTTALLGSVVLLTGCASPMPVGAWYTGVKLPVAASSNAGYTKTGQAKATSVLGLVATGDASIEAAKANGGISVVTHVDYEAKNILGLFGTYTTTVYGK
jgi:hypothetical protein